MVTWLWMSAAALYIVAFISIGSSTQQLLLVVAAFTGGSVCLGVASMIGALTTRLLETGERR